MIQPIRYAVFAFATAGAFSCALPWDAVSPPDGCERTGYCPHPDGGSQADVITVGQDGDSALTPDGGEETGPVCSSPTTLDCNGTCVDPTQPAHCGRCTNVCGGPDAGSGQATCTAGVCGLGCSSPTALDCNGTCVDPSQPAHCGSCSNACAGPAAGTGDTICTLGGDGGGTCSVSCTGATSETCGGSCYAPTDPNHCGSCTNACSPPPSGSGQATCEGATPTCGVSCTTGSHVCSADCLSNTDEPSDTADPCILTEAFGVFVAPTGSDGAGNGTRAAPYATVGNAMDEAKTKGLARVYACGSAGSYSSGPNLVVGMSRAGLTVYGGLDCTTTPGTWTYNASDRATVAPASGYAVQVTAAVTFEDFGFVSAPGTAAAPSSIAVFVSNATGVVLERCNVQAAAAAAGQNPPQPPAYTSAAPNGNPGGPPKTAPPGTGAGGMAIANPSCPTSIGGAGGSAVAGELDGQTGQPGVNNSGTSADCLGTGQGGSVGASVTTSGSPGTAASSWAALSASGWIPSAGQSGEPGAVGQGGGGGGVDVAGATIGGGGGGAPGGCGGVGGPPGTGGGSSIALLADNSSIALEACTLLASNAGNGGDGAPGQTGQLGGGGGVGNGTASCAGGGGGQGGPGGPGGGGAGGLSAGVVWTGTVPTITGGTQTFGTAGTAGQNGDGTTTATPGTAAAVVAFQ